MIFSFDTAIIIFYFIALLFIGIINNSSKFSFKYTTKNITKYTSLILIGTIFTSSVGGGTTIGLMQNIFLYDMSYVYGILLAVPFDIVLGIILLPKITQHFGKISTGDILASHYGKYGSIISGICATVISVGYIAAQVSVSSYIFEFLLGINKFYGIILSYSIVIIYTSIGGLKSVLYTNLVQFFGIILGIPLILAILLKGIDFDLMQYSYKYSFTRNENLLSSSIYIAINFSLALLTPNFIQRGLLTSDHKILQKALIIKSIIYMIFILIIGVNGFLVYAQYNHLNLSSDSLNSLNQLLENLFTGAKGLIAIGLLSSATSTADSDLNIISISLYNDIYKKIFDKRREYEQVFFKVLTAIIGFFSIIIALRYQNIIEIIMFSASFWAPIIFVPLIGVFYNIFITKKQFIILSGLSLIFCILWDLYYANNFKAMFAGVIFNFIVFSLFFLFNFIKLRQINKTKT